MTGLREAARLLVRAWDKSPCQTCGGTGVAWDWPDATALRAALAAVPSESDAGLDAPGEAHFIALATAVMNLREFLALHRKATGRSDVNIRKVLALIDDALAARP